MKLMKNNFKPGQKIYHYIYVTETGQFIKRHGYIVSVCHDYIFLNEYDPHTLNYTGKPKRVQLKTQNIGKVLFRKNVYLWSTEDETKAARVIDVFLYEKFKKLYSEAISCADTLMKFRNSHGIYKFNRVIPREKKLPSNEEED